MSYITVKIENLKSIKELEIQLPYRKGVYAITGMNGVGKSTVFNALSKIVYKGALSKYFRNDGGSGTRITYSLDGRAVSWIRDGTWRRENVDEQEIVIPGFYEASFIYGNRFSDAQKSKLGSVYKIKDNDLCVAEDFIIENLGYILRGDKKYYDGLHKVRSNEKAKTYGFDNSPYVLIKEDFKIHQSRMSSGEYLIIGLLDYLYRYIKKGKAELEVLILDEVELALHPSAQVRLVKFLNKISSEYNLCIYCSTHSVQFLSEINNKDIYHIERLPAGDLSVENPCYKAYVTRSLYEHDGFDFLFLVEDDLAKRIVEKSLADLNFRKVLYRVIPCGGWKQVLATHKEYNIANIARGSAIVSILDGDIKKDFENYNDKNDNLYGNVCVNFLPLKSIEKYLLYNLIEKPCNDFNDRFSLLYQVRSLGDIIEDYRNNFDSDGNGKKLYGLLKSCLSDQGVAENEADMKILNIIMAGVDSSGLDVFLRKQIEL